MPQPGITPLASTAFLQSAALESAANALVWTRSGSGSNVTLLTGDQFLVGLLPRKKLKTVKDRIAAGEPLLEVLGEHYTSIHFQTIRKISAKHGTTDLAVQYDAAGGSTKSCRVRFPDEAARSQALEEVRNRLPGEVEAVEEVGSRMERAVKPLGCLLLCSLLAYGAHWFFQSEFSKIPDRVTKIAQGKGKKKPRKRPRRRTFDPANPDDVREIKFQNNGVHNQPLMHENVTGGVMARRLGRNPAAARVLVFGIAILGAIGFVLGLMGYQLSMSLFIGAAALCLFWLLTRILLPPRSLTLVRLR